MVKSFCISKQNNHSLAHLVFAKYCSSVTTVFSESSSKHETSLIFKSEELTLFCLSNCKKFVYLLTMYVIKNLSLN